MPQMHQPYDQEDRIGLDEGIGLAGIYLDCITDANERMKRARSSKGRETSYRELCMNISLLKGLLNTAECFLNPPYKKDPARQLKP